MFFQNGLQRSHEEIAIANDLCDLTSSGEETTGNFVYVLQLLSTIGFEAEWTSSYVLEKLCRPILEDAHLATAFPASHFRHVSP